MIHDFILTTKRLGLRRWFAEDEAPFIRMNQDPDVMEYFPRLLSPEESVAMIGRIGGFFDRNGYGLFAVEVLDTREFIGYTGFSKPAFESSFTPCTEIGWRLKKEAWGHGYATEAAAACLRFGFGVVGLDRIYSFTSEGNRRSEMVMVRLGMRWTAKFEHPALEPGHPLRSHVLYSMENEFKPGRSC